MKSSPFEALHRTPTRYVRPERQQWSTVRWYRFLALGSLRHYSDLVRVSASVKLQGIANENVAPGPSLAVADRRP